MTRLTNNRSRSNLELSLGDEVAGITRQTIRRHHHPVNAPVRTSDGHILEWDRDRIVRQILKETRLLRSFTGLTGRRGTAQEIAREVEERIKKLNLRTLSGPLIREIMNTILIERGRIQWRNVCTRVGTPVFDAHQIDVGRFEAKDNANLQENAEHSHKRRQTR